MTTELKPSERKVLLAFALTVPQYEKIAQAAHSVYGDVSCDLPPTGKDGCVSRATIAEVCFDANRVETNLTNGGKKDVAESLRKGIDSVGYGSKSWKAFIKMIFPYTRYEVEGKRDDSDS